MCVCVHVGVCVYKNLQQMFLLSCLNITNIYKFKDL